MTIDVYFWTDIRSVRKKRGLFYAALSAETPKGEVWVPHKGEIEENGNGAGVQALHDIVAGDKHHIDPYKGSRIIIHSTSSYVTTSLFLLKKWKDDGWKTSKGSDIAYKDLWQEINCNLQGNSFEVIDEKDPEAIKELLETKGEV
ncbi:MAG: hypothetical protein IJJ01_03020 [Firmicutes bacterium]|nr:hypothetical protein [Bacillota bacterium]